MLDELTVRCCRPRLPLRLMPPTLRRRQARKDVGVRRELLGHVVAPAALYVERGGQDAIRTTAAHARGAISVNGRS